MIRRVIFFIIFLIITALCLLHYIGDHSGIKKILITEGKTDPVSIVKIYSPKRCLIIRDEKIVSEIQTAFLSERPGYKTVWTPGAHWDTSGSFQLFIAAGRKSFNEACLVDLSDPFECYLQVIFPTGLISDDIIYGYLSSNTSLLLQRGIRFLFSDEIAVMEICEDGSVIKREWRDGDAKFPYSKEILEKLRNAKMPEPKKKGNGFVL